MHVTTNPRGVTGDAFLSSVDPESESKVVVAAADDDTAARTAASVDSVGGFISVMDGSSRAKSWRESKGFSLARIRNSVAPLRGPLCRPALRGTAELRDWRERPRNPPPDAAG